MITQSGAMCDVCGKYILPIDPDELVNEFSVKQIPGRVLHCHNACKESVLNCGGKWENLPSGPLRNAYEQASKQSPKGWSEVTG